MGVIKERMTRVLKTLFYICFCFIILEGYSRFLISIEPIYLRLVKNNCDAEWRWRWVGRHNAQRIYYNFDIYDATKGWALKPNISNMVYWENKIVNSNSKGIRGKTEYSYARRAPRILILGDSFVFGDEVSDNETFPYYLQQILPDVEVINFGVHGYGHDQMLIYLKEEGVKYKPDIVILGFISYDSDRNMLRFRDYAKPKFDLINNKLKLSNSPVPEPRTVMKEEFWRSKFIDLLSICYNRILRKTGLYEIETKKLTDAILKETAKTVKNINAVPVFVYLSNVKSEEPDYGMTRDELEFLDRCKNMGVECAFVRSQVQSAARRQGIKIKQSGHFDAKTNELVALSIKEHLVQKGLLK